MTQAQLLVTLPEGIWIGELSRAYPESTVTVLAAVAGEDAGFGLVRITGPEIEPLLAELQDYETINELSVLQETANEATVQFETTTPLLQFAAQASGVPIEMPVEIAAGEATVSVMGSHDRLSAFASQLRSFGLEFDVEYIQERLHTSQLLSERQRELVVAAVEAGYYDTPRTCSLTELAKEMGIAKSTCSETLHRAEETMIKQFVETVPTPIESERRISSE